jgi:hypothetical protein
MNKSSTRWILLSIILLFSLSLIIIQPNAYAEGIDVKSFSLEETTIISVENNSNEEISTIRIWLGSDFNFKSFKTEKSWVGEKTPQGVVVFTTSESIKPGELVKFGVKTDKVSSGINWKVLDDKDKQIEMGKVLSKELPEVVTIPEDTTNIVEQNSEDLEPSINSDSIFRIVPEKPNVGASIRVTGDKFGGSQELDFYIDTTKIGSFVTDENGHFMTTMKIPETQNDGRVDFKIKDKEGEEKKVSLRIERIENRIPDSETTKLTIQGIPNMVHRGDFLEIFGTGDPNSAITSTVTNEEGEIYVTRTAEVDSKGNWELSEPIILPLDMPFGKYSATITDGRQNILKQWTVESDKIIVIAPSNLKFDLGELMKFNGTALPNKSIEVIIEDPFGKEIFSDIIQVDESGFVNFVYQTSQNSIKGTYTVIATQEKDKEFIFTGLGQLPTIPVNLEFDSLHYKAGDIANIALSGKASEIISLLIIDPSDKPKGDSISITLQPDGRGSHQLDLEGYTSGVYTAVISKAGDESQEVFTVGLQTGSGEIEAKITKPNYLPGDSILLLGDTAENVLLIISLMDPDGNIVKEKESFSDKNGKITESSLRIPTDAKHGMWKINVKSGSNFDIVEFEVLATLEEGMVVTVEDGIDVGGVGKTISIKVNGAQQTVEIEIIAEDGEVIETLSFPASDQGAIDLPWLIPKDTEPGIYTIIVTDAFNSAETTYLLE